MANPNKSINRPLTHATTYSGSDIRVFIYRDLVAAKEKADAGTATAQDGTVQAQNSPQGSAGFNDEGKYSSTTGTTSKGQFDPSTGTFKNPNPTNREDQEFRDKGAIVANGGTSNGTGSGGSYFKGNGLESIITELGSLHSINYSSFREKAAVRTLGRTHARSYTRGQRTIAGTMIFTVLQSHELMRFANKDTEKAYTMLDQIDPFNLLLLFGNEYGSLSALHLFNVDINTESQGMSIDSILLNNTMSFYAQDMLPMEDIGNAFSTTNEMLHAAMDNNKIKQINKSIASAKGTGLATLTSALKGDSRSDNDIRDLLQRSRGLF
jgi:hypothetical protein